MPKILLADDSSITRKFVKASLQQKGYDVDVAENGLEAYEMLLRGEYDLIVSDINMPRLDGFELVVKLRADDVYKNTPIILLSSMYGPDDVKRGIKLGANIYLTKPTEPDKLIYCVEQLLSKNSET
jgi:DNA-binding response OmpR family regulator